MQQPRLQQEQEEGLLWEVAVEEWGLGVLVLPQDGHAG